MKLLCTWLVLVGVIVEGRKSPPEGNCQFATVYKMRGADCSGINLVKIPPHLSSRKVEVLDASVNRIRILKNNSFEGFDYLRFLYLADNSISVIEPGTFEPLTELEVLDLSLNAIRDLPPLLPPTLRRLYLSENPLQTVPLSRASGLQFLALADCFLSELPELGELPLLQELNLSSNPLQTITVHQLASFCHLVTLTLPSSLFDTGYVSSCDCVNTAKWVTQHSIYVNPVINCTVPEEEDCVSNSTIEAEVFAACQMAYQQHAATHWAVPAGAAAAVILCLILLTVLWRRRWKRRAPQQGTEEEEGRSKKLLRESQVKHRF